MEIVQCMAELEDVDHVLCSCPSASLIWSALIIPARLHVFYSLDFKDWIRINCNLPSDYMRRSHDYVLGHVIKSFLNNFVAYNL
ncbi:hypothetical protein GQ457_04G014630 [Hibiscus cannabinus]